VEALVEPEAWAAAVGLDAAPAGPLTIAVEDNYGRGAAAVAAARLPASSILVFGSAFATRAEAFAWAELRAAEHPGSTLLAGPSLSDDPGVAAIPVTARQAVGPANLRSGLASLREAVRTGRLVHDGGRVLTDQALAARVVPSSSGGLGLAGIARTDAIRAAAWALGSIMRPSDPAPGRFVIR
jgi:hypothetical protein